MKTVREIVDEIETFRAAGLATFPAMAAALEDEDWETIFDALQREAARKVGRS